MNLYPAIDMLGGNAVRLRKGDFDAKKVYDEDPLSAARDWVTQGARALHVVDLDGAAAARRPRSSTSSGSRRGGRARPVRRRPAQPGGRASGAAGASRIMLGTAAFTDVDLLDDRSSAFGDRVVVSVDVRGGEVRLGAGPESTGSRRSR